MSFHQSTTLKNSDGQVAHVVFVDDKGTVMIESAGIMRKTVLVRSEARRLAFVILAETDNL